MTIKIPLMRLGILAGLTLLAGCSFPMAFKAYPVQGPLAAEKPLPLILGEKHGLISGSISLVLPSGEGCTGQWEQIQPITAPDGKGLVEPPPEHDLVSAWDSVYGKGFYQARVFGTSHRIRAKLLGDRGAVLFLEMGCGTAYHPRLGVAQDSRGNTYKLLVPYAESSFGLGDSQTPFAASSFGPGNSQTATTAPFSDLTPRAIIPAAGGPPVMAQPLGAGLYLPLSGGAPTPGTPITH